MKKKLIIETWL